MLLVVCGPALRVLRVDCAMASVEAGSSPWRFNGRVSAPHWVDVRQRKHDHNHGVCILCLASSLNLVCQTHPGFGGRLLFTASLCRRNPPCLCGAQCVSVREGSCARPRPRPRRSTHTHFHWPDARGQHPLNETRCIQAAFQTTQNGLAQRCADRPPS